MEMKQVEIIAVCLGLHSCGSEYATIQSESCDSSSEVGNRRIVQEVLDQGFYCSRLFMLISAVWVVVSVGAHGLSNAMNDFAHAFIFGEKQPRSSQE